MYTLFTSTDRYVVIRRCVQCGHFDQHCVIVTGYFFLHCILLSVFDEMKQLHDAKKKKKKITVDWNSFTQNKVADYQNCYILKAVYL